MKYEGMPICDLRHLNDVEAIKKIEHISGCAMVVFPNDAAPEIMSALAGVPLQEVASVTRMGKDDVISLINGLSEITENLFSRDGKTFLLVNGVAVIADLPEGIKGDLIVNGIIAIKKSLKLSINFPVVNGIMKHLDFDEFKMYPGEAEIDAETIEYLKPRTLILAASEIHLDKNITAAMLKEKEIILFAESEITCYSDAAPYVKATAIADKITVL